MIRSIRRIMAALMTTQTLTGEVLTTLTLFVPGGTNLPPLLVILI